MFSGGATDLPVNFNKPHSTRVRLMAVRSHGARVAWLTASPIVYPLSCKMLSR